MTNRPLDDLSKDALDVLVKRIGLADTVRFLRQFAGSFGDYTRQRQAQPEEKLEDVLDAIQARLRSSG